MSRLIAPRCTRSLATLATLATLALTLVATAALPGVAEAGPPWIAVELPANPHDAATRGALAVVRLYHHGTLTASPLEAHAVGLVDGARRTVRLDARALSASGVFAIRGTLPPGDGWVLVLTMEQGPTARASALVALDRRGEVAGVRVPHDLREGGRWTVPREASVAEVDAMLRQAVARDVATADAPPAGSQRNAGLALAGLGLALFAPAGWQRVRGARR
ncbi:MAG: hypothetical protein ACXW61_11270 [Gemmatirosa sp.]